jgi:L-2-hydroxyglutarate oxidase LhgO
VSEQVDCVVIGAGVIGLAIARALSLQGREVIVLEAEDAIGTGTSSRNSEVIHAGIYYPTGSLKARLCVAGKQMLYRFCQSHGVEHRRIGKLIVATSQDEVPILARYRAQANANGVEDLYPVSVHEAAELEPAVQCMGAMFSPSTGIIDSHGLMMAYLADIESRGGTLVTNTPVRAGRVEHDGVLLETGGESPMTLRAETVINSAGLSAQQVSHSLQLPSSSIPARYLAKGYYFSLSGRSPFRHLVYPIANSAGLGTHVTLDLQGCARFGPDVQWVESIDYTFEPERKAAFAQAIRLYYPALDDARLQPAYTGMRPKISSATQAAADFLIRGPAEHAGSPYVALYGMESPGLTASMAIAELVTELLRR